MEVVVKYMGVEGYRVDPYWGAIYQEDMKITQVYDREYVESRYGNIPEKVQRINEIRLGFVERMMTTFPDWKIIDYGCGTGSFVKFLRTKSFEAFGIDVADSFPKEFDALNNWIGPCRLMTFFDSLEHLVHPWEPICEYEPAFVIISVPDCAVLSFKHWKHRRYGEHLWHFDEASLTKFMHRLGYGRVFTSDAEDEVRGKNKVGMRNILTMGFERVW